MNSMLISLTNNLTQMPPIVKKLLGFTSSKEMAHDELKFNEKAVRALVKKLKKTNMLDEFERVITTRGTCDTNNGKCITIAKSQDGRLQISQRKCLPHLMYCKIFRWSDLTNANELKPLQTCLYSFNNNNNNNNTKLNNEVCINPYHYLRISNTSTLSSLNDNLLNFNNNSNRLEMNILSPTNRNTTSSCLHPNLISNNNNNNNNNNNDSNNLTIYVPIKQEQNDIIMTNESNSNLNQSVPMSNSNSLSGATFEFYPHNHLNHHLDSPLSNISSTSSSNILNQPVSPATSHTSQYVSEDDDSLHNNNNNIMRRQSMSPLSLSLTHTSSVAASGGMVPVPYQEQSHWCSVSYYELKQRVGETFHASASVNMLTIDGYTDPSRAERFCLGVLSNINRTPEVELTRRYIGRGIRLENTGCQVFAECLSENPVFVQSPICNRQQNWHLATVCKIPPGCKLPIFDINVFHDLLNETMRKGYEEVYALTRICTIRMSFVKGWGADYRRQSILNTPCWIEIHLNNPLQWIDHILHQMGSPRIKCTSNS